MVWYARLVFRWPSQVPDPVKYIWVLLWLVNLAFVLAAEITVLWFVETEIDRALANVAGLVEAGQTIKGPGSIRAALREALATSTSLRTLGILALSGVAAAIGWLALRRVPPGRKWICAWAIGIGAFVAAWCAVVWLGLFLKPVFLGISREYYVFGPGFVALTGAVLLLLQAFLIKFFGDVARYTIASPGNIAPRQKVRDRGLELLRRLSASGRYDRIVLVHTASAALLPTIS